MQLYVDHFNRRDWDGVRELISADARLTVGRPVCRKIWGGSLFLQLRPLALALEVGCGRAGWGARCGHSSTRSGHLDRLLSNSYECDRPQD